MESVILKHIPRNANCLRELGCKKVDYIFAAKFVIPCILAAYSMFTINIGI